MISTPHPADAVRLPAPVRVLALVLLFWVPFSLALEASAGLPRLVHYGVPAIALLLLRIGVAGLGVAAGRALWAVQPSAVQIAQAWLVLDIAVTALTLATPYFPSNRLPGARRRDLAVAVAFNAAWFVYLRVSPRVKACWARA